MTRKKIGFLFILLLFFVFNHLPSVEMPLANYDNSLIFSMTYSLLSDSADIEIPYLKDQFGGGLYAWLACSNFVGVVMDWHTDITNADSGIENFKDRVDVLVEKAETYGVGLHITLNYGISRLPQYYDSARNEDIRNAQWYNDNNIAAESQLNGTQQLQQQQSYWYNGYRDGQTIPGIAYPDNGNGYTLTTMSRYARKLRNHLEAKVKAALDYLTQVQQQHPGLLLVVSAPGEAEMNMHPVNNYHPYLQEYFCDYSPFAVLEFQDWVKHEGFYAPGEKYAGEGYWDGGTRYQGANGLQYFNQDFGTSFTTWELKYYHWNLSDPLDTDYTDNINPDPNLIAGENYTFGGMMPGSGPNFISGGFDPPRVMRQKGENPFWDLWQVFRETMVYHYVKDMAAIARQSGFPRDHYYTHQIPADYLRGTRPNDPEIPYLIPRYYSSASPLWTADVYDDIGIGVTMYDINFGTWYARTTEYILPVLSSMSGNWGAMEYNPEVAPPDLDVETAPAQSIYEQFIRLYDHNVHVISFFKWTGNPQYQFKDTNREDAAKLFFDAVKNNARQPVDTVLTPKNVEGFIGHYEPAASIVVLAWSQNIWPGLDHTWSDWDDFKEFVLYRGYWENFLCSADSEIARTTDYFSHDTLFGNDEMVYYKIAAVNIANERGNTVTVCVVTERNGETPMLNVPKDQLNFGVNLKNVHQYNTIGTPYDIWCTKANGMKDVLTVSLDFELREKLDILAKITSRSKSNLVVEAMKQYLATNEWKIYAVKEGVKQADRGQLIPHETIRRKWEKKHAHSLD